MSVLLEVRNVSSHKGVYRSDTLRRLAERVCAGEGCPGDLALSVLFCDDPFIAELNKQYRKKAKPTDVLAFPQEEEPAQGTRLLGDIVISLDTVARYCEEQLGGAAAREKRALAMRDEVKLLFCHGLLHLLGYDHANAAERRAMQAKQAEYLGWGMNAAWRVRGAAG